MVYDANKKLPKSSSSVAEFGNDVDNTLIVQVPSQIVSGPQGGVVPEGVTRDIIARATPLTGERLKIIMNEVFEERAQTEDFLKDVAEIKDLLDCDDRNLKDVAEIKDLLDCDDRNRLPFKVKGTADMMIIDEQSNRMDDVFAGLRFVIENGAYLPSQWIQDDAASFEGEKWAHAWWTLSDADCSPLPLKRQNLLRGATGRDDAAAEMLERYELRSDELSPEFVQWQRISYAFNLIRQMPIHRSMTTK
ncbi:unnamed protein product [Phytophthora lilii]|uniref:Unnamed protein product n=1 Tax=Phytophthora lilii TaxID=2077276 RepID=A0A9W6TG41_9STRA|nr:unnamed protein product [Phytophthora lilii]